jgi:DivIVA domain-containing protein
MGQLFLFIVVALTVAAIIFGVTVLVSGGDSGLTPVEPDGRALPLPGDRPLGEEDVVHARFDTAVRGYRMGQVDQALQRAAYDIGYKGELIGVLEAEVAALRDGRTADADVLRRAREAAVQPTVAEAAVEVPAVDARTTDVAAAEVPGAEIFGTDLRVDEVPADVIGASPTVPPIADTVGPAAAVADVPPAATPAKNAAAKSAAADNAAADRGDTDQGEAAAPAASTAAKSAAPAKAAKATASAKVPTTAPVDPTPAAVQTGSAAEPAENAGAATNGATDDTGPPRSRDE